MSSKKTFRCRKTRQAARQSLQLECLESRLPLTTLPPAGNVAAQLVGSTLFLTGDSLGNQLVVASAKAGAMAVVGVGTTINGAATPFVTTRPVTNIVATLNGGNDVVGFGNDADGFANQLRALGITLTFFPEDLQNAITKAGGVAAFSLPGSLAVTTGDGNDAVGIIGTVGGSIVANLGSAIPSTDFNGNAFMIGDPVSKTATNRIGGAVSVVGGNQNDGAYLFGTSVTGGVSTALGDGYVNGIYLENSTIGSLTYAGGTGRDEVRSATLTVRNGVSVSTGAGNDLVRLQERRGPPVVVGGGLVINTGADDDVVDLAIDARQAVSVTTGTGNDEVTVSASKVGLGLAINTGEGRDYVEITDTYVDQNAVIDAGAGDDVVVALNLTVRSNLFAYLGAGNDLLGLATTKALAAYLYGGTGANTLSTDAATRAGIRFLRYYQFQTVNNFVPG